MKKLAVCISLAAMLSVSAAAFAADGTEADIYNRTEYSVTDADAANYKTVLIQNSNNEPVYINQASNGSFGTATTFFLKKSPEQGTYTIKYGGAEGYQTSKDFYVGADPVNAETPMKEISNGGTSMNADGTRNVGFRATVNAAMQYKSVILKRESDNTYMGYDIDFDVSVSGDSGVVVGVQINNIPEDVYETGIEVSLSTKSVEEYEKVSAEEAGGAADEEI